MGQRSSDRLRRRRRERPLRPSVPVLLVVVLLSGLSNRASAYRTASDLPEYEGAEPVRWLDPNISFELQGEAPPGLSASATRDAIADAFLTWSRVGCSDATPWLRGAGAEPVASGDGRNGVIFIREGWTAMGFSASAAATSEVLYNVNASTGEAVISEADLFINAEVFRWGNAPTGEGVRDLEAVVAHETGHLLGLLHPCEFDDPLAPRCGDSDASSSLYPAYLGLSQRELGPDDIEGVCWLYPATRACPSTPCGEGFVCVEGLCMVACAGDDCGGCGPAECPSVVGDPCSDDSSCAEGFCSDAGLCSASCVFDSNCPGGYSCEDGLCGAGRLFDYGDACVAGDECASQLCLIEPSGAEGTMGSPGTCTRHCSGSVPCPGVDQCTVVDGMPVCRAPNQDGCSTAGSGGTPLALWIIGCVFLLQRRRKHVR